MNSLEYAHIEQALEIAKDRFLSRSNLNYFQVSDVGAVTWHDVGASQNIRMELSSIILVNCSNSIFIYKTFVYKTRVQLNTSEVYYLSVPLVAVKF